MIYYLIYLWWTALIVGIFLYKVPSGTRKAWFSTAATNVALTVLGLGLGLSVLLILFIPGPAFLSSNAFLVLMILLFEFRR